jgi:ElaB/YqjD/DUF883 family membrane-anchored ribosome-binding protein
MKAVDYEHTVRRTADRLHGSASRLIDTGQGVVNTKLSEAAEIIQGAFSHLLDESQSLIRSKMSEASEVLHRSSELAADGVKRAVDQAKERAEETYVEWDKVARHRPLAIIAVAVAVGFAAGLVFRRRPSIAARASEEGAAETAPKRPPVKSPTAAARRSPSARKTGAARKAAPAEPPPIAH